MKRKSLLFSILFSLLFPLAHPALAGNINYTLVGSTDTIRFSIAQQPAIQPACVTTTIHPDCFSVSPVAVTVNGTTFANARVNFFRGSGDGLSIFNGNTLLLDGLGPVLFTGPLTAPTLQTFSSVDIFGKNNAQFKGYFLLKAAVASLELLASDGGSLPTDGLNSLITPGVPTFGDVPTGVPPGQAMIRVTSTVTDGTSVTITVQAVSGAEGHQHLTSTNVLDIPTIYTDKAGNPHSVRPTFSNAGGTCDQFAPMISNISGTITNGKFVTFICAGELALDLNLTATVGDPAIGNLLSTPTKQLRIRLSNLQPLTHPLGLVGFSAEGTGPLSNGTTSHPGDGFWGLPFLNELLQRAAETAFLYQSSCNLLPLNLEGISLSGGGLFDIGATRFKPPHWRHRAGNNADIGFSGGAGLYPECRRILFFALTRSTETENIFPVRGENPLDPTATHWHLQVPIGPNFAPLNPLTFPLLSNSEPTQSRSQAPEAGAADISPQVAFSLSTGRYRYSYSVTNAASQPVEMLQVLFNGGAFSPTAPSGWAAAAVGNSQGEAWGAIQVASLPPGFVDDGSNVPSTAAIPPGEHLGGFSFESSFPPTIGKSNVHLYVPRPVFDSEDDLPVTPVVTNNVIQGFTVAPRDATNLNPSALLADLTTLKAQATSLGWIDSTIGTTLDQKLGAINVALTANSSQVRALLQDFMSTVQTNNGVHLSSEAHALLFFNAQFLLAQLPNRRGQLISD